MLHIDDDDDRNSNINNNNNNNNGSGSSRCGESQPPRECPQPSPSEFRVEYPSKVLRFTPLDESVRDASDGNGEQQQEKKLRMRAKRRDRPPECDKDVLERVKWLCGGGKVECSLIKVSIKEGRNRQIRRLCYRSRYGRAYRARGYRLGFKALFAVVVVVMMMCIFLLVCVRLRLLHLHRISVANISLDGSEAGWPCAEQPVLGRCKWLSQAQVHQLYVSCFGEIKGSVRSGIVREADCEDGVWSYGVLYGGDTSSDPDKRRSSVISTIWHRTYLRVVAQRRAQRARS